jgi:ABC-type phosphate transport system substrate-binding protein
VKRLMMFSLAALLAVGASGCGVDSSADDSNKRAQQGNVRVDTTGKDKPAAKPTKKPAPFTPGLVRVRTAGGTAVTRDVTGRYMTDTGSARIEVENAQDEDALKALCEGKVDIVDSARRIPERIWRVCHEHGLDVVEFHIASDAIVLATRAETDTGADCLTQKQVRDIYRAGSPYYRWSQLGYYDLPLRVAGTDEDSPSFKFFATYVLGSHAPAISDVRSDYVVHDSDSGTRMWLVGTDEDQRDARLYDGYAQRATALRAELSRARSSLQAAKTELRLARDDRQRGIRDQRSKNQQRRDQARQDRAWTAYSAAQRYVLRVQKEYAAVTVRQRKSAAARSRINTLLGRLGFVRFSYYGLYEDQLRPLEIDAADEGDAQQCIFPSRVTITSGQYPYARPLLLTTTTRSLNRPEVKALMQSYLAQAREAALRDQMIPVTDGSLKNQRGWLKGDPDLVVYDLPEEKQQEVPRTEPAK